MSSEDLSQVLNTIKTRVDILWKREMYLTADKHLTVLLLETWNQQFSACGKKKYKILSFLNSIFDAAHVTVGTSSNLTLEVSEKHVIKLSSTVLGRRKNLYTFFRHSFCTFFCLSVLCIRHPDPSIFFLETNFYTRVSLT